jgi:ferredoxin--NADP+ reductase
VPAFNPEEDRVMICGSMGLNIEIKELLEAAGMEEGANSKPGHFVVEKAFVGEPDNS